MKSRVSSWIAWRYLFSKKSHSAVTAITTVSVVGVAIATAAIICVLSVFNGFRSVISMKLDSLDPDILIQPVSGKVFADADSVAAKVAKVEGVAIAMPAITDNALALMNEHEIPVTIHGVSEDAFRKISGIEKALTPGSTFCLTDTTPRNQGFVYDEEMQEYVPAPGSEQGYMAAVAIGVATRLGINTVGQQMMLFAPRREGRVNLANPVTSFEIDSVAVAGVWQTEQADFDKDRVVTDIAVARRLFQYDSEASAIEVAVDKNADVTAVTDRISKILGPKFTVKDRLQQHEVNFRMINIEKWVTFLLLTFILIIASFNLISTISMLILEKQNQLGTLKAMGNTRRKIGRIFAWESFFVTLFGAVSGIILGLALSLLQQNFGLIKLSGDTSTLTIDHYPVEVHYSDILFTLIPIVAIGALTAIISYSFAVARSDSNKNLSA